MTWLTIVPSWMRRVRAARPPRSDQASSHGPSRIPWKHEVIGDPCGVEAHHLVALHPLDDAFPIVLADEGHAETQRTGAHGRISYSALNGLSIGTRRTLPKPDIQAQVAQSGLRQPERTQAGAAMRQRGGHAIEHANRVKQRRKRSDIVLRVGPRS